MNIDLSLFFRDIANFPCHYNKTFLCIQNLSASDETLVIFRKDKRDIPDLPSEGTLGNFIAVLSGYTKLGVQVGPGKVQVD